MFPLRLLPLALLGLSATTPLSLNAETVTTTPVGAVTITVKPNADQRTGITLLRPALYSSVVSGTPTTSVTVTGTIPALGNEAKFIRFKTGAAEGMWFQITATGSNTITVAENLSTFGVADADEFEVRPFWTLATLFPQGGGLAPSSDVFNPEAFVLLIDPQSVGVNIAASKLYFYHDGSQGDAGWYSNDGSFTASNNIIISPETSIILRNSTAQVLSVINVGDVPVERVSTTVVARSVAAQDNVIYNPYPHAITLDGSGLVGSLAVRPSSDVFNPADIVFVYSTSASITNAAASASYFYHDGAQGPAGWYTNDGSFAAAGNAELPPGVAFVIRKGPGSDQTVEWAPALPY